MIIGCDVDGVVAHFYGALLDELERQAKAKYPVGNPLRKTMKYKEVHTYWASDYMPKEHVEILDIVRAQNDFWSSLELIKDAKEGISALREAGHTIKFVTSPTRICKEWEYLRLKWLQNHFPWVKLDDLIICSDKSLVDVDIFIDDWHKHTDKWKQVRKERNPSREYRSLLFAAPYNRRRRTYNWQEIVKELGDK